MRFMQTESVLQTKNRSGPAKNRISVALGEGHIQMLRYEMSKVHLCHVKLIEVEVNGPFRGWGQDWR